MSVRLPAVVGTCLTAVLLTACSSTVAGAPSQLDGLDAGGSTGPVAAPGTIGFLYASSSTAIFLQWTSSGAGPVEGTIKVDTEAGTPASAVSDETNDFTGQVNPDGGVVLDLPVWRTVYGTESDSTLTLNLPQQGGGLQAVSFHSATPDDYNSAVASLRTSVDAMNQQGAQRQQISQDESTLSEAFGTLQRDEQNLTSQLEGLDQNVSSANNDTSQTENEAQAAQAQGTAEYSSGCGDVAAAGGDASAVGGDASALGGTLSAVTSALATVRQDMATVNHDLDQVKGDVPGYQGAGSAPSPTDVQNAASGADIAINHSVSTANADIDKVNGDITAAFNAVATAAKATDCDQSGPPPDPIKHIK